MRALLIGATGFIGRAVLARLATSADLEPVAAVRRRALPDSPSRTTTVRIAGLSADTDWSQALYQVRSGLDASSQCRRSTLSTASLFLNKEGQR
jgi:uncharacterized protein YbjT (DUF2867 family)